MEIKSNSFTYHYVALPPQRQIPSHSQPEWELSLVVKGRGRRHIGETMRPFKDGDLVLIPPWIEHCWYFDDDYTDADGNVVNVTLMFTAEFMKRVAIMLPELAWAMESLCKLEYAMDIGRNSSIRIGVGSSSPIGDALVGMYRTSRAIRAVRVVEVLVMAAGSLYHASYTGHKTFRDELSRKRMLIDTFVACNFTRRIQVDEIASLLGMTKSTFCVFFRRHFGDTFIHYLNNYRLDRAHYRLRDASHTISEVCYGVGFQSVSHFNHLYKERFGHAPGNDRQLVKPEV